MRAALISIAGQQAVLAGKTLARRQLDFVLAAGCDHVFALGDGASAEVIGLRHATEAAGARFQAIRNGHGLLGAIGATDELLVLAPGLLPESAEALAALQHGHPILVMRAEPAVAAGLERIDLERAWAGAMVVPGRFVERLSELPPDSEPAAALLRIALQARLPERRMPEQLLADGTWSLLRDGDDLPAREREWIRRGLPAAAPYALAARTARAVLPPMARHLLAWPYTGAALMAGVAVLLAAAVAAAGLGWAGAGFALVALAAVGAELSGQFAVLRHAPLAPGRWSGGPLLALAVDAALALCAFLAIGDDLPGRLFPALALLGMLHARPVLGDRAADLLRDRACIGIILALGAAAGFAEVAIMAVVLAMLAADVAKSAAPRG